MLYAIAIYTSEMNKLASAPQNKGFFNTENPLEGFDSQTKLYINKEKFGQEIHHYISLKEHHYLKKISSENIIIAIISKKPITQKELTYLFNNISYIHKYPKKSHYSLEEVVTNPYNFTGKDIATGQITDQIDRIKDTMHTNIAETIKRGQDLQALESKAITLKDESEDFNKKAKKLNSCCR